MLNLRISYLAEWDNYVVFNLFIRVRRHIRCSIEVSPPPRNT
jgi:hypothetical protein